MSFTREQMREWFTPKVIKEFFIIAFVVVVIRSFIFEPYRIPTGSMIPNLMVGDFLFVSKYAYGYNRFSLPFDIPLINGTYFYQQPKYGDIIVFKKEPGGAAFVKRLVGLPGDEIRVIDGKLYLNGEGIQRNYIGSCEKNNIKNIDDSLFCEVFLEKFASKSYKTIASSMDTSVFPNTTITYKVPEGHIFFMGDNRDHSADSRFIHDMGFIPASNIIGRVEIVFFNFKDAMHLDFTRTLTRIK